MAKLVDAQRSGRCESDLMRVRVPLRAQIIHKYMENLHQYSEQAVNWQKSVSEISKFIIDHLEKEDFFDYFCGETIDNKDKEERWNERLEELYGKATSRLGYKIDRNKLLADAKKHILDLKDKGELLPSKILDRFCEHIEEN